MLCCSSCTLFKHSAPKPFEHPAGCLVFYVTLACQIVKTKHWLGLLLFIGEIIFSQAGVVFGSAWKHQSETEASLREVPREVNYPPPILKYEMIKKILFITAHPRLPEYVGSIYIWSIFNPAQKSSVFPKKSLNELQKCSPSPPPNLPNSTPFFISVRKCKYLIELRIQRAVRLLFNGCRVNYWNGSSCKFLLFFRTRFWVVWILSYFFPSERNVIAKKLISRVNNRDIEYELGSLPVTADLYKPKFPSRLLDREEPQSVVPVPWVRAESFHSAG